MDANEIRDALQAVSDAQVDEVESVAVAVAREVLVKRGYFVANLADALTWHEVGTLAIDSGQVFLADPCYLFTNDDDATTLTVLGYDSIATASAESGVGTGPTLGVVGFGFDGQTQSLTGRHMGLRVSGFGGDVPAKVMVGVDGKGLVREVRIVF